MDIGIVLYEWRSSALSCKTLLFNGLKIDEFFTMWQNSNSFFYHRKQEKIIFTSIKSKVLISESACIIQTRRFYLAISHRNVSYPTIITLSADLKSTEILCFRQRNKIN
jgi:tRNA uridine 5-carbamoylmethylation protein Kti12